MDDNADDLNYDFNYNMFIVKNSMRSLSTTQDKHKVLRWLRKLSGANRTLNEMRIRNDFMYYLVMNVQNGELQYPFKDPPPAGPLPAIAQLLPGGADVSYRSQIDPGAGKWAGPVDRASPTRPLLYRNSPDGGAFLAAQPIPRCGAFCYMAVISKPKPD